MTDAPYYPDSLRHAYQLHYHIGIRTRQRTTVFGSSQRIEVVRNALSEVCKRDNHHLLESEIEGCWVHRIINLRPSYVPVVVVQTIKANTIGLSQQAFPALEIEVGQRPLWSRGHYVRGIRSVPNSVLLRQVAQRRTDHKATVHNSTLLAKYRHSGLSIYLAVLADHVHTLIALKASQSPKIVVLALLNNSLHWFWKRRTNVLKTNNVPTF